MNNNKKEELNYHNLNEVIGLSKKMLKKMRKSTCILLAIYGNISIWLSKENIF